jgi:MFS family permease
MQSYRSPAVALMPDVTAKPLRSTANGIINLIGYFGGVFATVLGMFSIFKLNADSTLAEIQDKVIWPFVVCTAVFIAVLIFLLITIRENKMVDETKFDVAYGETMADTLDVVDEDTNALSSKDRKNLIIILISIFLWFMSFNAFETFGSLYFKNVVGDSTLYSTMATILSVVSILTFLTCSTLSYKIGRKLSVLIGLFFIIVALAAIAIISLSPNIQLLNDKGNVYFGWKIFYMGMSVLIGIGWALVNINSFPMVVEYSNTKNLGKFTSLYYISSMLAQTFTPVLVGLIMDFHIQGQRMLFVYSSLMMLLAIIVFIFVKDKVNLKERKEIAKKLKGKSKLEILGDIDD